MTDEELIRALKYLARKKQASRSKINKAIGAVDEDRIDNQLFYDHAQVVSDPQYNRGYYVPCHDDIFRLNDQGANYLAERIKEKKAIRRANLALLLSLAAVVIAAISLIYTVFYS